MTVAVTPEKILKELSELWISLGKEDPSGVVRACSMTLVMAVEDSEDAGAVGETLAEVMHSHPSRAIVLRVKTGDGESLGSRVFAQCWMPFGKRQQICCEQIEITATESSLPDVPRIIMGLIASDLPVVLVCRSARLFSLPAFQPMIAVAGKVIVDSHRDPRILRQIGDFRARKRNVLDLAWTRLTRMREAIARLFDNRETLNNLGKIDHIRVAHQPGPRPSEAFYLAGWLKRGIGGAGVEFEEVESEEVISCATLTGDGVSLRARRISPAMMEMKAQSAVWHAHCAISSDAELLREELSMVGSDRILDETLPAAVALAEGSV